MFRRTVKLLSRSWACQQPQLTPFWVASGRKKLCKQMPHCFLVRNFSRQQQQQDDIRAKNSALLKIIVSVAIGTLGLSYAAVPLYRLFCQATGYGGTTQKKTVADLALAQERSPRDLQEIVVYFNADVSTAMPWKFTPLQDHVVLVPGESVLAFYNVENNSDEEIVGISTYNVTPLKAGLYFNKIQCFCFEEQKLQPRESVDMPVFFFIDPDIVEDKRLKNIQEITLSYTFFRVKEGEGHEVLQEAEREKQLLLDAELARDG